MTGPERPQSPPAACYRSSIFSIDSIRDGGIPRNCPSKPMPATAGSFRLRFPGCSWLAPLGMAGSSHPLMRSARLRRTGLAGRAIAGC